MVALKSIIVCTKAVRPSSFPNHPTVYGSSYLGYLSKLSYLHVVTLEAVSIFIYNGNVGTLGTLVGSFVSYDVPTLLSADLQNAKQLFQTIPLQYLQAYFIFLIVSHIWHVSTFSSRAVIFVIETRFPSTVGTSRYNLFSPKNNGSFLSSPGLQTIPLYCRT